MLDLPNDNWVRGQKMPDWSLCLDPASPYYGWKMYECNGNWVSGNRLTGEEVVRAMEMSSLREHRAKFQALLDHRAQQGKR